MTGLGQLVYMWEARVEPGRLQEALTWVRAVLLPSAATAGGEGAEAFCAAAAGDQPGRVVVLTRWPSARSWVVPDLPVGVFARAHGWEFRELTEVPGSE